MWWLKKEWSMNSCRLAPFTSRSRSAVGSATFFAFAGFSAAIHAIRGGTASIKDIIFGEPSTLARLGA